jgi:carbonic anhydrase
MAAAILAAPVQAAQWHTVATHAGERVQIDTTRIMRGAAGTAVAWTQLQLGRELPDSGGAYTSVQAMNRYDCAGGRFATLRRVYRNGDQTVREEAVNAPREVAVTAGSVDAKLLAEACRTAAPADAKQATRTAGQASVPVDNAATPQAGKPGVMYADVRAAEESAKMKTVPVADGAKPEPAARPELAAEPERPKTAADTKIEIRPPSERPRFIGLPKVERPPVDNPPAAPPADVKSALKPASKPTATAKAPADAVPASPQTSSVSRHERERMLATSSPRRALAAKAAAPAEAPAPVMQHRDIQWSYEGDGAPANWGRLRPEYALCANGRRQSPIDIRESIKVDLEPIRFDYKPSRFRIVDTGRTIEVEVGEGSTMNVMGRNHELLRFHFHRPSEERINGKAFDMVVHLEHRDDEGRLATVAVLLEKGAENPLIQTLWNHMPLEVNQEVLPEVAIDLNRLLPESRAYYTYMGSMTTPPCAEDMLWIVFRQPMSVSEEQVRIFTRLYRNNTRSIQPSNNRLVKENR